MCVSYPIRAALLAVAVIGAVGAYAFAQPGQPGQPSQQYQPTQPGQISQPTQTPSQPSTIPGRTERMVGSDASQRRSGDASHEVERFIAQCLITKNQGEVEIAQFAAQRAQHPQVKQFAQMLVQDHQAAIQKLQGVTGPQASIQQDRDVRAAGFTGQANGQTTTTSNQPGRDRDGSSQSSRNSDGGALQELAAIERQVAERCQQALREKLQSKQGAEFDHCFVGAQVMGHMHMLAQLEVIQQETSGPLKEIAQESQPKVKRHLEQAEQLAEQLMGDSNRPAGGAAANSPTQR